jgi:hypothetical protein
MKICWILVLLCCAPILAFSGGIQKANVHSMRKVHCPEGQSNGGILNAIIGPGDSDNDCIEYELRTEKVSYVIRPNRSVLLIPDSDVSFKMAGSILLLHTDDAPKDIRCAVISMELRSEEEKKERSRPEPRNCRDKFNRDANCPDNPDEPANVRYDPGR